jgi:hypothetical protein
MLCLFLSDGHFGPFSRQLAAFARVIRRVSAEDHVRRVFADPVSFFFPSIFCFRVPERVLTSLQTG